MKVKTQEMVEARIARQNAARRAAVIARRKGGTTHARIAADADGYFTLWVCNTLAGDHWYVTRVFKTLRAAQMFCRREYLTVIEQPPENKSPDPLDL